MAAASFVNPFTEQFAFATSLDARRKLVASELVAGTTDHYIYNALVDLQLLQECHDARVATGTSTVDPTPEEQTALKSLRSLLKTPPTSFRPYAPGWEEISRKFHLFNYAYDPQSTLEYLKKELGLSFDHFPAPVDDEEHDLSVSSSILDPALIDTATLLRNQIPLLAQESTYNSTIEEFEESLVLRHLWPATATMDSVSLRSYMDSLLRDRPHPRLSNLTARLHDAIVKFSRTEVPTATELPGHSLITAQILKNLPLSHLLELRTLLPVITENSDYVLAVLRKLAPRIDACLMQRYDTSSLLKDRESGALDQAEQERFLRMALEFVETLSQTYLDLRFTILHAWLKFGMERNVWHEEEFLRYVRIPKHTSWYSVTVLPTNIIPSDYVTFGRTFDVPFIRPVSSAADQILMTEFLTHHFLQYRSYEAFVGILDLEAYLKPLFARTMIMARIGNAADWYPLLGATGIQALSTNSELAFTPQSAHANLRFAPKDLVKLNLRLKNIRTLTIREFRVDTLAYYRQTQKEFDETIDLDGLTPARERVVEYGDKPSVERHEEAFEFGEVVEEEEANVHVKVEGDVYQGLKGRGVWVVDFVGGRQSCRAVVRKGTLRYLVKDTVAGHLFTILDEAHRRVTKDCSIWIASKSYLPDASGDILLPYTTRENINEVILLTHSGFTALRHFHHKQERYGLGAGFYVNPEAIMKDKKAQIVVHPHLTINNQPAPLAILEAKSVQLTIESEDSDGVSSTRVIDEFVINEGECGLAEFRIPDKLSSLSFTLKARVRLPSDNNREQELHCSYIYDVEYRSYNEMFGDKVSGDIDRDFFAPFLRKDETGYYLQLLGKNGETRPNRPVPIHLKHKYFSNDIVVTPILRSDVQGIIRLGPLHDVTSIATPQHGFHTWKIDGDEDARTVVPDVIQEYSGTEIVIPVSGKVMDTWDVVLVETGHNETVLTDQTAKLIIRDHEVVIPTGLDPGNYTLYIDTTFCVNIVTLRIVRPALPPSNTSAFSSYCLGHTRHLESTSPTTARPLGITSVAVTQSASSSDEVILVKLQNHSPTRTIVLATVSWTVPRKNHRLDYVLEQSMHAFAAPGGQAVDVIDEESVFLDGRTLSDEYEYILERARKRRWTGNVFKKPTLLVKPYKHADTSPTSLATQSGTKFIKKEPSAYIATSSGRGLGQGGAKRHRRIIDITPDSFNKNQMSRLDFIDGHTTVIANFRPDARGTITLCRSQLGQGNILQLVVLSNDQQVSRQIVLPSSSPTLKLRDLRHRTALDPNGTYVSAKNVSFLNPPIATPDSKPISVTVEMGATSASELEIVGSLRKLYTLMITLGGKTLNEEHKKLLTCFKFLTRWHSLDMEDKLRLYDQWACHELNFWLFKRDRGFFERVAKPFIQNKIHRTFLDDYLLDMPLNAYISSFQRFNQLNVAEQCLLVKKIGGESEHARTLEDAVKDAPIDRKEFEQLFGTVLAGSALNEVNEISDFQPQATASYVGSAGFDVATSALVNNADRDRDRIRSQVMKNNEECDQDIEFGLFDCYDDAEDAEMEVEESKPATNAEEVKHTGLLKLRQLALSRRQALYQNQRPTEELAETHYWGLSVRATTPKLVTVNAFWADYAKWTGKEAGSFLSENFIYATKNFTEIMFVLALLELPLNEPVEPEIVAKDARVSFRSTTPAVIFHKELKQCSISASDRSILVIQNYFVDADRIYYEYDDNKTGRKYIDPKDFRRHIVYGCHIVLTNTSSIRQTIELFFQIPVGAVPVKESQYIVTQLVDMKPFTIWQDEYFFYFPKTGSFPHLPVYVSKSGELLAHSPTTTVIVTDKPRPIDRTSWTTIAIHGSSEDVLGFLEAENLNKVQLDKITWRAKGRDFCVAVTDILRKRNEFDDDLWAYGFFHELPKLMREYLEQKWWSQFSGDVFYFLRSPLLNVRADETGNFLHLDYYPLVNARVHHVRRGNRILNNSFLDQYHHFLKFISRKPQLESADLLSIVIYLLLQDRLEEAQTFHELLRQRVESANGTILQPQLQLDYLAAFFEFYVSKDVAMEHPETIDFAITRELTRHYRDYPVLRWRGYFDEMARFLEEVDGHRNASAELAIDEREELRADQLNERLARQQPSFDFEVKDDMIVVSYLNVDELTINYYVMNVEMTFSTSPFVGHEGTGNHTFIAPNYCETHKIPAPQTPDDVAAAAARESGNDEDEFAMVGGGAAAPRSTRTFRIPLAPRFRHANIMLEMVGAGITRSLAHYAHALTVQIAETYGYLRVSHRRDGNPVPAAYVKVYAKMTSGKVRFWRDGYTALNGSFEYASLSEKDSDGKSMLGKVRRFAILVQGDDFGAVVKEVGPPKA